MKAEFRYDKSRYETKGKQHFQECMEYCLEHNYGTYLQEQELARLLGYNIEDEKEYLKYRSMMGRIKTELIEYGKVLKSVKGGYYILKPNQVSSYCYRSFIKRSQRQLDKSLYIIEHIDVTLLNDDRIEEYNNFKKLNSELIAASEAITGKSEYFDRLSYYNSLKD